MVAYVCGSWHVGSRHCPLVFQKSGVALGVGSPQETSADIFFPEASETVIMVFGLELVDDAGECG